MEAHMSSTAQPGAPAVGLGQLDQATALAVVRGVTEMVLNCRDFLVFPDTGQWKDMTSRVDDIEEKLDSLHEGVNTRLDTMTTRLNSMESNMNTRFDRLDTQLMMVITQLTETNARLTDVDRRLAKADIKFEALNKNAISRFDNTLPRSPGDRLEPLYSVRTGEQIQAVQSRTGLDNLPHPTVTECLQELNIAPERTRDERSRQLKKAYGTRANLYID
ncbi:hypothetical protein E4U38_002853 [Claviceps purpurea]|nr:hypothetical protein E4U38_002853 [Claviceps purpurea]